MNEKPKIIITSLDARRLTQLLAALPDDAFPGKTDLQCELDRAEIVDSDVVPPTVVTMNSTVRFRIEQPSEESSLELTYPNEAAAFCLTLVYPDDVGTRNNSVSVFAPVGSALLGLSQGDRIEWPRPGGGTLRLRIEEVTYQPERSGEYHR